MKAAKQRADSVLPRGEINLFQQFGGVSFQCPVIIKTHFSEVKLKTTEYGSFQFDPKTFLKVYYST
jgi:hypothetical protein